MKKQKISLQNIKKSFQSVRALDDVSIDIEEGLITAIVGDNGSGKSTMIKIMSGNLEPDSGRIIVGENEYKELSLTKSIELGIRTVYQNLSLDDYKNSVENVFLGQERMKGIFLDRHQMEKETRELLEHLEIQIPDLKKAVRFLSGGQRQGVAIARALINPGEVLLLDEPTAAMGIKESDHTLQLLKRLQKDGMTLVLVSHNLHQVFSVADRVFVMRAGKCVADIYTKDSSVEELELMLLDEE